MTDADPTARLADYLDEDVVTLLTAIRTAAIARVTEELVPRYAAALLSRLDGAAEEPEDPAPARAAAVELPAPVAAAGHRPTPADRDGIDDAVYMYAVVAGDGTGAGAGIGGVHEDGPVRHVVLDGLTVVVSDVSLSTMRTLGNDEALTDSPLARAVAVHDHVVDVAFRAGPTIPLRFGTVVADDAAVTSVAGARRDSLIAELRRLGKAKEWSVRVLSPVDVREPVSEELEVSNGADYLRRHTADRAARALEQEHLIGVVAEVRTGLAALASEVADGPLQRTSDGQLLMNASYLVADDREAAFLRHCEVRRQELAAQGVRLERTGPWPPYHFVDVDLS